MLATRRWAWASRGVQAFYFTAACSGVVASSVITLYASAVIAGTCLNATYAVFFEVGIEGKRNTAPAPQRHAPCLPLTALTCPRMPAQPKHDVIKKTP